MKRVIIGLGLLAGAAFLLWPEADTVPPTITPAPETSVPAVPSTGTSAQIAPGTQTVTVKGLPLIVQNGALQPTPSVIALFNAWLGDTQSQRYEDWKPNALGQASSLPTPALDQLGQWLDQYVELNLAMQLMTVQGEPSWDNILKNVRAMRDEYFGNEAAGLFSEQIALEDFTETAVTGFADVGNPLSQLVDLKEQATKLPAAARERAEAMLDQWSQALQRDPSLNENSEEWNRLVQASAAATLETPSVDLTEANAGFLQRYNAYAVERENLLQQGATDEQLKALRATHFTGAELLRAGTLDKALAE